MSDKELPEQWAGSRWRASCVGAHFGRGIVRPNISAATTAALTDETRLKVR